MADASKRAERRVSAPLVLAAASAMLAVAVVVWVGSGGGGGESAGEDPRSDVRVDASSPERVAESFYDAWRRRRWEQALEVSTGAARRRVVQKQERDRALPREERVIAERMWDALARAPLTLALDEAEMLPNDRFVLRGTAEYDFVSRPYRRRVEFDVVRHGQVYRVSDMRLGEVLTELPPMFTGAGEEERP